MGPSRTATPAIHKQAWLNHGNLPMHYQHGQALKTTHLKSVSFFCLCVCNHTKGIRRAELAACWHLHTQGIYLPEHLWCQMCVPIPTSLHNTHANIYKNNETRAQLALLNFVMVIARCTVSGEMLNHLLQSCCSVAQTDLWSHFAGVKRQFNQNIKIVLKNNNWILQRFFGFFKHYLCNLN